MAYDLLKKDSLSENKNEETGGQTIQMQEAAAMRPWMRCSGAEHPSLNSAASLSRRPA